MMLYIKYDMRDIINPRSLPNPPEWREQAGPPFTFRRLWQTLRAANKAYADSWRTPQEPEPHIQDSQAPAPPSSPAAEDLAAIAKGGANTI
ncbi:hypothetical protein WJX73_006081 [Symbiochloris irregularis]|uniref:Uncharacterized protein n=1 Tax=Symbiochloris irregularis TaxID=706552 RepID=A0AAW1PXM0_9CHLO